jgi:hypothetical protein
MRCSIEFNVSYSGSDILTILEAVDGRYLLQIKARTGYRCSAALIVGLSVKYCSVSSSPQIYLMGMAVTFYTSL